MSVLVYIALIVAAIIATAMSIGALLLMIKLLSVAFVMGFVLTGLIIVGLVAWQAHYFFFGVTLFGLACVLAVSTVVLFARNSTS